MIKMIFQLCFIFMSSFLLSVNAEENSTESKEPTTLPTMKIIGNQASTLPLSGTNSTGSRLGLTLFETPATVDVISSEIMQERGYSSTIQALSSAPGVSAGQCFGIICIPCVVFLAH